MFLKDTFCEKSTNIWVNLFHVDVAIPALLWSEITIYILPMV